MTALRFLATSGGGGGGTTSPLTTKGDIYTYSTTDDRLPVGTNGQILSSDSTQATGLKWIAAPTFTSPLTTKGDLYTYSSADARLAIGTNNQFLIADSTAATGNKWTSTLAGATITNSNTATFKDTLFTLQDDGDATKLLAFQLSGITTGNTRTLTVPDASTTIVGTDATQTITNKTLGVTNTVTLKDTLFTLQDDGDLTKQLLFQLSGITTGTTRTLTIPDASTTIVGTDATQTLTNKTFGNTNTVTLKDTLFTLQDDGDTTKQAVFQLSGITTSTTRTLTLPDASITILGVANTVTVQNKTLDNTNTVTLKDTLFTLQDDGDTTKQLQFQLSGITTGTTRTITVPNTSFTMGLPPLAKVAAFMTSAEINPASGGLPTTDGYTILNGDRVAVSGGTSARNGIWVAASGAWARATDCTLAADIPSGRTVFVDYNQTNRGGQFLVVVNLNSQAPGAYGNFLNDLLFGNSSNGGITDSTGLKSALILTAKGDLISSNGTLIDSGISGSAAQTSRLSVGSNGQYLKADSTQTTGLGWAAAADEQIFTSSGTWTKPTSGTITIIEIAGAGGGGASGRRGAAGTGRSGGGGGAGGSASLLIIRTAILGATETITIGAGGTGAAGQTANDTDGSNGGDGGSTSFGSWTVIPGAFGGQSGTTGSNAPGGAASSLNGIWDSVGGGTGHSVAVGNTGGAPTRQGSKIYSASGGGGGGGLDSSNVAYNGGPGGATIDGPAGGLGGAGDGSVGGNRSTGECRGAGGGGGSGATSGTIGGAGGTPGGGGGGGNGQLNGTTSGAGGAGAAGRITVTTI